MVANVGGPDVAVDSLVPAGADVHTFDPTPGTIAKLAHADVVVMNGLGVDGWLDQVVADAGAVAPVKLGEGLDVPLIQDEAGPNPHLWMDVAYAEAATPGGSPTRWPPRTRPTRPATATAPRPTAHAWTSSTRGSAGRSRPSRRRTARS